MMIRSDWTSVSANRGSLENLADLRAHLVHQLALLLTGASSLALWLALPQNPFPALAFILLAMLLGLGLLVLALADRRPDLARHVLVWGLTGGLLAAMGLFAAPWLPCLGLLLLFVNTMLISGSELATAGLIALLAAWLTWSQARDYSLPGICVALGLGIAVAWLTLHTLYTTLHWTTSMQQRADRLLEEVRAHRSQLSRTLKSSEIVNALLRRTERELIAARKQADQARRLKEQFAANISHELRTPLNLILGFSEIMHLSPEVYTGVDWTATLRRDVYQIYRSSRHLMGMIDDILDLSRFEIAEFTLNKEPTPLSPLLQDTGDIAADLFRGRAVRLEMDFPPDLPTLEVDRTRVRQVLLNLLSNARRFTTQGAVRLAAEPHNGEVLISVSDTGRGIPADKLPYIFDEFYQVDLSLQRRHQGAGLGLAISKRFVQAHGGSIWAESEEGNGTTITFSLPMHASYSRVSATAEPEYQWPARPPDCILVADPDPAVTSAIRRSLEGYEVVQVEDPEHLSQAIMIHHPRAVVRNVPPPTYPDGADLTALPVPVIECSLPSQAWLADDLKIVASLTKPISAQQLVSQIERLRDVRDVLVVDDDRGFVQLVERILDSTGRGMSVRRAYDGEESLAAMRARAPDLVLLDVIMPGLDGFQVLERMRQEDELAVLPVILLTATSFAEDALRQRGNQMIIRRFGEMGTGEVLRCLGAVIGAVEPHYDERALPSECIGQIVEEAASGS
jgi:signal transduction histidine kinase/CheY-like chemotaxis protein